MTPKDELGEHDDRKNPAGSLQLAEIERPKKMNISFNRIIWLGEID